MMLPGFAERIGLAWQRRPLEVPSRPARRPILAGSKHPIARNFDRVHFHDESYWNLLGDTDRIKLLATGVEEDEPQPLFWTHEPKRRPRVRLHPRPLRLDVRRSDVPQC